MQDVQLQLETDEWAKRRQQTQYPVFPDRLRICNTNYRPKRDLNETGRQAINATITALEQQQTRGVVENRARTAVARIGIAERKALNYVCKRLSRKRAGTTIAYAVVRE